MGNSRQSRTIDAADIVLSTACGQGDGCCRVIEGANRLEFLINVWSHTREYHPENWGELLEGTLAELLMAKAAQWEQKEKTLCLLTSSGKRPN